MNGYIYKEICMTDEIPVDLAFFNEILPVEVQQVVYESLEGVTVVEITDSIYDFITHIVENFTFLDSGSATIVWESEKIENFVLKMPFLNHIGRNNMCEIIKPFVQVNTDRVNPDFRLSKIKESYINLNNKLSDELYSMLYKYHGQDLSIIHKIVAHNRFFKSKKHRIENPKTVYCPHIYTLTGIPIAYTQQKVVGQYGSSCTENMLLLRRYGCVDRNYQNVLVTTQGEKYVIDAAYSDLNTAILEYSRKI